MTRVARAPSIGHELGPGDGARIASPPSSRRSSPATRGTVRGALDSPATAASPTPATVATPPAVYESVEAIDARVASIDDYLLHHSERLEVYAEVPGREELVPVHDTTQWPDETEASYNILRDSTGAMVLHRELPTSQSGDWFASVTHYLAPDGRTILYVFEISAFSSGCRDILRESKRVYFSSEFGVLKEERAFTDNDGRPVDATNCYRRSDDAPPARRGATALRGASPPTS